MRNKCLVYVYDFGGYNIPFVNKKILIFKVIQVFQNATIVSFISNENVVFKAVFAFG